MHTSCEPAEPARYYQASLLTDADRIETAKLLLRLGDTYLDRRDAPRAAIVLYLAQGIIAEVASRYDSE